MSTQAQLDQLAKSCVRAEAITENLVKIVQDHESRLRWIERLISYGSGVGFAVYYFITNIYIP